MNAYGTVLKDLNQLATSAFLFKITMIFLMTLKAKSSQQISMAMRITMKQH